MLPQQIHVLGSFCQAPAPIESLSDPGVPLDQQGCQRHGNNDGREGGLSSCDRYESQAQSKSQNKQSELATLRQTNASPYGDFSRPPKHPNQAGSDRSFTKEQDNPKEHTKRLAENHG